MDKYSFFHSNGKVLYLVTMKFICASLVTKENIINNKNMQTGKKEKKISKM